MPEMRELCDKSNKLMQTPEKQQTGKPLTEEQLWGPPEEQIETIEPPKDLCLYRFMKCPAWDGECTAAYCIMMNGADDGTTV